MLFRILILISALVYANALCLARCVSLPCHQPAVKKASVPPCHRQQPASQSPVEKDCRTGLLVADQTSPETTIHFTTEQDACTVASIPSVPGTFTTLRAAHSNSPPGPSPDQQACSILRI